MNAPSAAPAHEDARELRRRLSWLLGLRLSVASLLLGGTLLLSLNQEQGVASFTPRFLLALITATYCVSLGFAVGQSRARRLERVAAIQIGWDLVLASGLVYAAGGAASGFTFLYGTTVLMAALVVGPNAARLTAVASTVLYVSLALSLTNGWLAHPVDQPGERYLLRPADATFTVLVNILGLLLVAFLATNLANRLTLAGGRLRVATAQAAELARLNEDIIRSLSSGLVTTDADGVVRSINPAGLVILGAHRDQVVGQRIEAFFAEQPSDLLQESTGVRADGRRFPVALSHAALLSADGARTGDLLSFQDLSELMELRLAADRAERLAALGRLAAALAHEIRNPLGSISGSVQLVRDSGTLGPEDSRLLGIVLREVDRLDALVNTMLQVSRAPSPVRARTALVALTSEVVEVARRDHRSAGARITVRCPSHEVYAAIDGDQIKQVVWNLLSNALTHTPAGTLVQIEVREDGAQAVWSIEDEGPGVPVEARGQLFDMFYSKRPHGIGLGLALVEQIVRAHGGEVQVVSPPGRGAKFEVRLPRAAEEKVASRGAPRVRAAAP